MAKEEKTLNEYDVVKKLIGEINPVGDANEDEKRFANLKKLTELVDKLVNDIDNVAYNYKNSYEFSVKRACEFASKFLTNDLRIVE